MRQIGKHPKVNLSVSSVHEVHSPASRDEAEELDALDDAMLAELLTLVPHPEEQLRLANYRARFRPDISDELRAWLEAEVARLGPYRRPDHERLLFSDGA